jgi:hypothetical protein
MAAMRYGVRACQPRQRRPAIFAIQAIQSTLKMCSNICGFAIMCMRFI